METDSWTALPGPRLEMADYILNATLVSFTTTIYCGFRVEHITACMVCVPTPDHEGTVHMQ